MINIQIVLFANAKKLNFSRYCHQKMSKVRKTPIKKAMRRKVWDSHFGDTTKGSCYVCDREIQIDDFEAGHVISEKNGGKVELTNLRPICKPCNQSCGTMNMEDFRAMLQNKPKAKADPITHTEQMIRHLYVKDQSGLDILKMGFAVTPSREDQMDQIAYDISANDSLWSDWKKHHELARKRGKKVCFYVDQGCLCFTD